MSSPLATYSFLPWLRQGIANNITQDADMKLRASIPIRITVSGTKPDNSALLSEWVEQQIQLYGPGDIIGIDSKAIIKTEPRNWITNFEPNYLPYIDFYEEDFPWRYTPAAPDGDHLSPWLTLVVLKEDEFEDGANMKNSPLPYFKLKDGKRTSDIFPKFSELWAWAHVHVNTNLSGNADPGSANAAEVTAKITDIIRESPDLAYSRIICPRKLEANIGYYAFLIPTFESGRLAGLGREIATDLIATTCAWADAAHTEFPYYHRWYFRTGNVGDFEYLVNLLEPKLADKSVGVRDMDVLHPGSNLPRIDDPALQGILKLGGALRVPFDTLDEDTKTEVRKYDEWDEHPYPHAFTTAMAHRINLADDYASGSKTIQEYNQNAGIILENDEADPDPVITSPLYGRWHALQQRLLKDKDDNALPHHKNWVHELNLDPRFRVAAGIGTRVVQKNQEEYMQAAWEQVGKIVEANNKIVQAQVATEVSLRLYEKKILSQPTGKSFVFTAPVHRRIIYNQFTVQAQVSESRVPPALTSGVFRSMTRPRGALMKNLSLTGEVDAFNLVQRVNEGNVVVVPPKKDPEGAINLADVTAEIQPDHIPSFLAQLLQKHKWFRFLPLFLLLLIILVILLFFRSWVGISVLSGIAAILTGLFFLLKKWEKQIKDAHTISQEQQTPEAVDTYPKSPDFTITEPGSGITPSSGSEDSEEAQRFKAALKDAFGLVSTQFPEPEKRPLDLRAITGTIIQSLNPTLTIPRRTFHLLKIPPHLKNNMVETFAPVMAYPEMDIPMYKPLADISSEFFLPNINKIEQNSITLLENNQKFIEAYMVGINHEMSRELLWREYPTDQRGTCFRQFWDVNSFLPVQPPPADLKEQLRDIPPIHQWSRINTNRINPSDPGSVKKNELGSHNQRALNSGKTQLVLVIRGELLKKYPTAVIYAHKAAWGRKDGTEDIHQERVLAVLSEAEEQNPPLTKIKTPLFEAKIEPDIYFFGFDLDDDEARGTIHPASTGDVPGWFFVLKERPGEPRFGLDIDKAERIINWNNLSWEDVGTDDGKCIELDKEITFQTYNSGIDQENEPVQDDIQAGWNADTNSAELAYILYQAPVMVAIHASRMLPR